MSGFSDQLDHANDKKLLEIYQKGSPPSERRNAFEAIYKRYRLDVLRFIKSKVKHWTDAEEISSDVWVIALRRLRGFEWRENTRAAQPLKSWLLKTADNKTKEYFRKIKKERRNIPLEDVVAFIESKLDDEGTAASQSSSPMLRQRADQLMHQALNDALNELSPNQREVLILTHYNELNAPQIGEILNMEPGTVRQHRHRGRQKLRKILAAGKGENNA